jgi:phosphocarrier protein
MQKSELTIMNQLGMHARPAAKLVRLAAQHKSNVFITYAGTRINAKSIMGLMMLAVEKGGRIHIEIEGEDEIELMSKIKELIASGFGEA